MLQGALYRLGFLLFCAEVIWVIWFAGLNIGAICVIDSNDPSIDRGIRQDIWAAGSHISISTAVAIVLRSGVGVTGPIHFVGLLFVFEIYRDVMNLVILLFKSQVGRYPELALAAKIMLGYQVMLSVLCLLWYLMVWLGPAAAQQAQDGPRYRRIPTQTF